MPLWVASITFEQVIGPHYDGRSHRRQLPQSLDLHHTHDPVIIRRWARWLPQGGFVMPTRDRFIAKDFPL